MEGRGCVSGVEGRMCEWCGGRVCVSGMEGGDM